MFEFTFGDVGSGKSLRQAKKVLELLESSKRLKKRYPQQKQREVWCNFHMNPVYEKIYPGVLHYWKIPQQMIFEDYPQNSRFRKDFDCVWDEMAVEIPSDHWKDTDPAIRAFFAQHRKRGIWIYGNTQDYMMLDINARRMATQVYQTHKVIGNRDPSATLAPITKFWGLIIAWHLDKKLIREDDMARKHVDIIPEFIFYGHKLCHAYDTAEDIRKSEQNQLLHVEFECPKCKADGLPKKFYTKVEHLKT